MNSFCITMIALIVQCVSTVFVVGAFLFDINVRRNTARQNIAYDWLNLLMISKIEDTLFKYIADVSSNYYEYRKNLKDCTGSKLKETSNNAISHHHKLKIGTILVLISHIEVIEQDTAKKLTNFYLDFEDEVVIIMERASVSDNASLDFDFERLSRDFSRRSIELMYTVSQDSVKLISRKKH